MTVDPVHEIGRQPPVGVVGVGALGAAVARRFLGAGYRVRVFDPDAAAMDRLAGDGATPVDRPSAVAEGADLIVTCVPGPPEVEACIVGPGGLRDELREQAVVIEMSTSLPGTTRRLAGPVHARGADLIDAPVSRGVPAAERGTLSILVGGDEAVLERSRPHLEVLGTDIAHLGPLGAGHAVKLLNMGLMAVHLLTVAEALALTAHQGIGHETAVAYWDDSPARSFMTANHFPKFVLTDRYDSGFTLGLMRKDLELGAAVGAECHVAAVLTGRALDVYRLALTALTGGRGDTDNMRIVPFCWDSFPGAVRGTGLLREPLAALGEHLAFVNAMAVMEALVLLERQELRVPPALDVIAASSGGSEAVENVARGRHPADVAGEVLDGSRARLTRLHEAGGTGLVGAGAHEVIAAMGAGDSGTAACHRWAELLRGHEDA